MRLPFVRSGTAAISNYYSSQLVLFQIKGCSYNRTNMAAVAWGKPYPAHTQKCFNFHSLSDLTNKGIQNMPVNRRATRSMVNPIRRATANL